MLHIPLLSFSICLEFVHCPWSCWFTHSTRNLLTQFMSFQWNYLSWLLYSIIHALSPYICIFKVFPPITSVSLYCSDWPFKIFFIRSYPKFYFASVTSSFKPISTITYPSHSASFWVPSMGQRLATIPGLCVPELLGAYPCFSLFWKRQGLPISLAALTSSFLPWSLFLRPPSGAWVRLLFFRWACLCSSHLSSTTSGSSWWSLHFPQVWFYSFSLHFLKNACRVLTAKRLEHSKLSVKSPFTSRPGTAHTPGSWLAAGVGGLVGWFSHKVTRLKKALSWTTAVLFIRL